MATVEDRLKEVKLKIPIDDAVESILNALPGFLRHVYVKWDKEGVIPAEHQRKWHTSKTSKKPRRQND